MKKFLRVLLLVVAPLAVLSSLPGCSTTPKCDNDACYNRKLASEDPIPKEDADTVIKRDTAKEKYWHYKEYRRH